MTGSDFFVSITPEGDGYLVRLYFDGARHPQLFRKRWVATEAEAERVRVELLLESTGREPVAHH